MKTTESTVFVVDDDAQVRSSLRWLLESVGFRVETHASAEEFEAGHDHAARGCVLLDIRMPGMSGLELLEKLAACDDPPPIIIMTGYADVAMAVRALKHGAVDFIEKPFNEQVLLECIRRSLDEDAARTDDRSFRAQVNDRIATLTPREREVMGLVVEGLATKQIALELGISPKTVEVHRARIMRKMKAASLAELVRMVLIVMSEARKPCPA